jgi:Fe2+ or Zn2+ uptake regulation protein
VGVRSTDELAALFRRQGRKVTAQRLCIFDVLQGDVTHPTAEAVHAAAQRRVGAISLKTVYQTLNDLAALGEIAALDLGTGTVRFDPNVESGHHHLVCRTCGKVRDLHVDFSGLRVPRGSEDGFDVGEAEVLFRGVCAECRRGQPSRRHPPGAPPIAMTVPGSGSGDPAPVPGSPAIDPAIANTQEVQPCPS